MSEICPHCGAELSRNARGCKECGSDERTGWKSNEEVDMESIELPSDDDYDDFLEREGLAPKGSPRRRSRGGRPKLWIFIAGVILLGALVFSIVLL